MWGALPVSPESCVKLAFNSKCVFIRRIDDEWLFSNAVDVPGGNEDPAGDAARVESLGFSHNEAFPPDVEWLRLVSAREESLELVPTLPDRPLVIRPESPVSIFPGRFASFYVSVPIWYRFVAVRGKERIDVIDFPSEVLSNTWFGEPGGGELCYSLDAPLKRSVEHLNVNSTKATCALVVKNGSQEKLNFERICVHIESLSVFAGDSRLWTNEIGVLFKGIDQISQLNIQKNPPTNVINPIKMCDPRLPSNRSVLGKSFSFIRSFSGI